MAWPSMVSQGQVPSCWSQFPFTAALKESQFGTDHGIHVLVCRFVFPKQRLGFLLPFSQGQFFDQDRLLNVEIVGNVGLIFVG